jgi:hypothetical protein
MKLIRKNETSMASVAYLSDGVISLALIGYESDTEAGKATSPKNEGKEFVGLHRLGFWVDDIEGTKDAPEENGRLYI